jgi:hypothetical protein
MGKSCSLSFGQCFDQRQWEGITIAISSYRGFTHDIKLLGQCYSREWEWEWEQREEE